MTCESTHSRLKEEIAGAIRDIMTDFGLSQVEIARRTGLNPAVISHMMHGQLRYVGLPNLITAFNRLGGTVEVDIINPDRLPLRID